MLLFLKKNNLKEMIKNKNDLRFDINYFVRHNCKQKTTTTLKKKIKRKVDAHAEDRQTKEVGDETDQKIKTSSY